MVRYDYVPITQRPRLEWPDGNQVALIITVNMETWDLVKDSEEPHYAGGPPVLPDPLPSNVPDFPNYSWREYGQRVGIWRLLDVMDECGVKPSCTINAKTALERSAMVEAAIERDLEILAHNYEQGELLTNYAHDREAEAELIARTLAVYEQAVGRKAKGWLSSSLRGTLNTPAILAEHGLRFYCDIMNDDQPFLLHTDAGDIVSLPYTNEINDFTLLTRRGLTSDDFRDVLIDELTELHREGEKQARIMNVGLHPHVIGRAYRMRALREFFHFAKDMQGVWWPTREQVVDAWAAQQ